MLTPSETCGYCFILKILKLTVRPFIIKLTMALDSVKTPNTPLWKCVSLIKNTAELIEYLRDKPYRLRKLNSGHILSLVFILIQLKKEISSLINFYILPGMFGCYLFWESLEHSTPKPSIVHNVYAKLRSYAV